MARRLNAARNDKVFYMYGITERPVDSASHAVRIRRQPMLDQLCGQEAMCSVAVGFGRRTKHQAHAESLASGPVNWLSRILR